MPSLSSCLWGRNQNQFTAMQFAPTTNIAVVEFEGKDRTVMLVMPIHWRNCSLPGIDLHKRSRTNNRVQRVILHPDVTVKRIVPVHLLQQCVGNIFPIFDYLRHEVGSFGLQPLLSSRVDKIEKSPSSEATPTFPICCRET